jgi:hypothetical protein
MKRILEQSVNSAHDRRSLDEEAQVHMRPGSRWNGKAANPFAAALYGVVVSLAVGYALSYLFGRAGLGVISGPGHWDGKNAFMLAGLSFYASQHISLIGSGMLPGDTTPIHAAITLPMTVWAAIPTFALMVGGFVAANLRRASGRWGMIGGALGSGIVYTAVLVVCARWVSARFLSTAIPAVQGFELNPPDISFHPAMLSALLYGSIFGVVFSYFGGLLAVRSQRGEEVPGKWWACAKALLIVGLSVQILMAIGLWAWFTMNSRLREDDPSAQPKFAQMLPTAAGMGYVLVHATRLSCAAVPVSFPSAAYRADLNLYRGATVREGEKNTFKPLGRYVWIAALIGAIAAFLSGRLAVKLGSRDGSLPTAIRIILLHSAYIGVIMLMCSMGWGIAGQSNVTIAPRFDTTMLFAAGGVFVLALAGAHWANRRYAGRLSGFPSV